MPFFPPSLTRYIASSAARSNSSADAATSGSVATPIWDKAGELDVTPYATTAYAKPIENVRFMAIKQGKAGLPAETLGNVVARSLTARWPKLRYAVSRPSIGKVILSLLSQRTIDRMTANAIGLKRTRR